jgi:hypothetical protein
MQSPNPNTRTGERKTTYFNIIAQYNGPILKLMPRETTTLQLNENFLSHASEVLKHDLCFHDDRLIILKQLMI